MSISMSPITGIGLKLLPAVAYVLIGYASKRYGGLKERPVTNVLFFILIPVVVFRGAYFSELTTFAWTAVASFAFGGACAMAAVLFAPFVKTKLPRTMLMCVFGCFNIGWFGIPVVLAVYGEEAAAVMTALYVGGTIFGNTVGYALAEGATASAVAMLRKIAGVPALYGLIAALLARFLVPTLDPFLHMDGARLGFLLFAEATSLLGMGLVGMSMVRVSVQADMEGVFRILLARLLATAALAAVFVGLASFFSIGSALDRQIFLLLPCLPIAANLLVFVNRGGSDPGLMGLTIVSSTILSFVLLSVVFVVQHGAIGTVAG